MKNGARYPFTCDITVSEDGGSDLLYDLECDLEIHVDLTTDWPIMEVTDVWLNGTLIPRPYSLKSNRLTMALRERIIKLADDDIASAGDLWTAVCERECLHLTGLPGDPDATWQRGL